VLCGVSWLRECQHSRAKLNHGTSRYFYVFLLLVTLLHSLGLWTHLW